MPAISPESVVTRLAKEKTVGAVVLIGEDAYRRGVYRQAIIESCVEAGSREWAVARCSAADDDLSEILGRARTSPMLVPRQVIVVCDIEAVEQLGERARESALKDLTAYLENPCPFTMLVLEAAALDQRMKLGRLLVEKALVAQVDLPKDGDDRAHMAVAESLRMARELGSAIERDAAEELVDLCGASLAGMRSEIEKLASYAGPGNPIRLADVKALVVSENRYSVWEFADLLAAGNQVRAFAFLDNLLRAGESAPALIGAMAWMYRKLLELQDLGPSASAGQAASRVRMRLDTAKIALQTAKRIPRRRLIEGLGALYEADNRLKSNAKQNGAVMEFLLARLMGGSAAKASPKLS